ncbi:MAG: hypothetical protein V1793_22145 [Pseudomonadota bacterium]
MTIESKKHTSYLMLVSFNPDDKGEISPFSELIRFPIAYDKVEFSGNTIPGL